MIFTVTINGYEIAVDQTETAAYYLDKIRVSDNCQCANCRFYAEHFCKLPLEIFQILASIGVDIERECGGGDDPQGLWSEAESFDTFRFLEKGFKIEGSFVNPANASVKYEKIDHGLSVVANFEKDILQGIMVWLSITKK